MAGILVTVGIGVMDYKGLKAIPYMPRPEVMVMIIVLVLSSLWNLVYAVGIGLIIASLMFMKKMGDLTSEHSHIKSLLKEESPPEEANFTDSLKEKVFVKHMKGPLFFGSTNHFENMAKQIPESASVIIIRMGSVPYMDQTGLFVMEDVIIDLGNQGKLVILTGILDQPRYMLERIRLIPNLVPEDQLFDNFKDSLIWLNENNHTIDT